VGAAVRVGGAQVGLVKAVHAVGPTSTHPSFARVELAIDPKLAPLPADSSVRLRPISILGGKYVSIDLGTSKRKLPDGKPLPLAQAVKTVDIDQALRIFGPQTRRAIQGTVTGFGNALAGRGAAFGETIGAFDHLVLPLGRVADTLTAPSTRLPRFFDSGARLAAALAPVGPQLDGLIRHAGPSFAALRGTDGALGDLIQDTPRLERAVTPALGEIEPILADATVVSRNLGRGTRRLPQAVSAIDSSMRAAKPSLELSPDVARRLQSVFVTLRGVAIDPATTGSLRILTETVQIVTPLLRVVDPAQSVCNVLGLVIRNYAAVRGQGDANGSFARSSLTAEPSLSQQSGTAASNLHYNAYPNEDASECEGGNEPYLSGKQVGNPPGQQPAQTEHTAPPKGTG
jgi:ABC-type transporter Mla subunit MlaD